MGFDNSTSYQYYKVVFPTTKGVSGGKRYMHLSEARLFSALEQHAALTDDAGVRAGGVITTAAGPGNYLMLDRGASAEPLADYTVMFDIQSPEDSRALWRSLLQTSGTNADDGELFIHRESDLLGNGSGGDGLGYLGTPVDETRWQRVVFVSEAGAKRLYIDGDLVASATSTAARYTLGSKVLFFADDNFGNAPLNVGKLALWERPLSGAEVATLGTAERLGMDAYASTRWSAPASPGCHRGWTNPTTGKPCCRCARSSASVSRGCCCSSRRGSSWKKPRTPSIRAANN